MAKTEAQKQAFTRKMVALKAAHGGDAVFGSPRFESYNRKRIAAMDKFHGVGNW